MPCAIPRKAVPWNATGDAAHPRSCGQSWRALNLAMSMLEPIGASGDAPSRQAAASGALLTTNALRAALQAQVRSQRHADAPELRRLAQLIAVEARRRSSRAEPGVVQLRQTWLTLHEAAQAPPRGHAVLIDRLISLCVEEYYRVPDDR